MLCRPASYSICLLLSKIRGCCILLQPVPAVLKTPGCGSESSVGKWVPLQLGTRSLARLHSRDPLPAPGWFGCSQSGGYYSVLLIAASRLRFSISSFSLLSLAFLSLFVPLASYFLFAFYDSPLSTLLSFPKEGDINTIRITFALSPLPSYPPYTSIVRSRCARFFLHHARNPPNESDQGGWPQPKSHRPSL